MKISARNVLRGTVKQVMPRGENVDVIVELPGGTEIVSSIAKTSAEDLNLGAGKPVFAVIRSANVILAVDDGR